jgi:mercuric ion transport protein
MMQSRVDSAPPTPGGNAGTSNTAKSGTLAVAGISGVLASVCCIGPLVLVSIGLSGAAAGIVATFEPLRPVFIVIAFAALAFAGWRIYRGPVAACAPGIACDAPQRNQIYKTVFWGVAAIVLALISFPYYAALLY